MASTSPNQHEIFIPAAQGRPFQAAEGDYVTLIDVEGQQIGDFVAFNAQDHREWLSTAYTRSALFRIYVQEGDYLYSNLRRPMFQIVEDEVGRHDITLPACDATRYEQGYGLKGHPNCLDNLSGALSSFGIERWHVPEPFNVFQNSLLDEQGAYHFAPPLTKPGDRIVLRALMNIVGAVSACSQDQSPSNGYKLTPLRLVVSADAL